MGGAPTQEAGAQPAESQQFDPLQAIVIAVGGRLELRLVGADGVATRPDLSANPAAAADSPAAGIGAQAGEKLALFAETSPTPSARSRSHSHKAESRAAVDVVSGQAPAPASGATGWALPQHVAASLLRGATVAALAGTVPTQGHRPYVFPEDPDSDDVTVPGASGEAASSSSGASRVLTAPPEHDAATAQERDQSPGARQEDAHSSDAEAATSVDGRRYGTFPILVSGQLLEPEFVALGDAGGPSAPDAIRWIRVSLQTPGAGRLELTAQYLGDRVRVSLAGGTAGASGGAPPVAIDVAGLLQRLGWGSVPVEREE